MIIGNFTHNKAKDTYEGDIQTLTLLRGKVAFRPTEAKNDKGPNYRVVSVGTHGSVELGAAWKRTTKPDGNSSRSASTTRRFRIRSMPP